MLRNGALHPFDDQKLSHSYSLIVVIFFSSTIFPARTTRVSKGKVLKRFCKQKHIVHDFLEEEDELHNEWALLCYENWLLYLAF